MNAPSDLPSPISRCSAHNHVWLPGKIVSGGQTGADRAALDWAIERGVPHGGWCPKRRFAEDGCIDERYKLQETPSSNYLERTEWNVRDSDGTVVFSIAKILTGGAEKTVEFAKKHGRPLIRISKSSDLAADASSLRRFVEDNGIRVLNVAGPRESEEGEIGAFVKEVLDRTW
jgi:hypothetical protein